MVDASSSPRPVLVAVFGPSGAGKSVLAEQIARRLRLPMLRRDDVKEALFDTLGSADEAWSNRLGAAGYEVVYKLTRILLDAGVSLVVETNFLDRDAASKRLQDLQAEYGFVGFRVFCTAEPKVLAERCRERAESGERHPGHFDTKLEDSGELEEEIGEQAANWEPIEFDGELIAIDTTDFDAVDYDAIAAAIAPHLPRPAAA